MIAAKQKLTAEQIKNIVTTLLICKTYPELKTNPADIYNDIHPQALLNDIYDADPEKYLGQITRQLAIGKNIETETEIKRWLHGINFLFTAKLFGNDYPPEKKKALFELEKIRLGLEIHRGNLELIEIVGDLARKTCNTKAEKLEFYRTFLDDLKEEYKEEINKQFRI